MRAAGQSSAQEEGSPLHVRLTPEAFAKPPGGVRRTALGLLGALRDTGAHVSASRYVEESVTETSATPSAPRRAMLQVVETSYFARRRMRGECGVAHSLYYDQQVRMPDWPLVVTVNDMIHERFGAGSRGLRWAKRYSLSRASLVITPSRATAADVLRLFPDLGAHVVTIPWAIDEPFLVEPRHESGLFDRAYLLYVGARSGYKNFAVLLHALAGARDLDDLRLVAAGGPPLGADEERALGSIPGGSDRFIRVPSPSDADLRRLYDNAAALVVTSRCEGFGLPLLEAMARSCPVAGADGGSTSEIADGHAVIFPPDSSEACADAIRQAVALSPATRRSAQEHAARYTWEATAQAHLEAYRLVQRQRVST